MTDSSNININEIDSPTIKKSMKSLMTALPADVGDRAFKDMQIESEILEWFEVDSYNDTKRKVNTINKLDNILSYIVSDRWLSASVSYEQLLRIYLIVGKLERNNSLNIKGVQQLNTLFTDQIAVLK